MMISLHIEAKSVEEYYDALQKLLAGAAMPGVNTQAIGQAGSNVVSMPSKSRPRKAVDNTVSTKGDSLKDVSETPTEPEQEEVDELAESLEPEKTEAPKIALTNANVKALAIRYINDAIKGDAAKDPSIQDGRRALFAEVIAGAGVTTKKFSDIPDDKLADVVQYVTDKRAEKQLKVDEIRD